MVFGTAIWYVLLLPCLLVMHKISCLLNAEKGFQPLQLKKIFDLKNFDLTKN